MSNSLLFCQKVASDPSRSSFSDRPWEKAKEIESRELFLRCAGEKDFYTYDKHIITVDFQPNADFEYFTSASSIHDGTIAHEYALFVQTLWNIFILKSYNKAVGLPKKYVKYTVGKFVYLDETGNFGDKDQPWLQTRTTVLLPLIYQTSDRPLKTN